MALYIFKYEFDSLYNIHPLLLIPHKQSINGKYVLRLSTNLPLRCELPHIASTYDRYTFYLSHKFHEKPPNPVDTNKLMLEDKRVSFLPMVLTLGGHKNGDEFRCAKTCVSRIEEQVRARGRTLVVALHMPLIRFGKTLWSIQIRNYSFLTTILTSRSGT
jgi:hypothetical protein